MIPIEDLALLRINEAIKELSSHIRIAKRTNPIIIVADNIDLTIISSDNPISNLKTPNWGTGIPQDIFFFILYNIPLYNNLVVLLGISNKQNLINQSVKVFMSEQFDDQIEKLRIKAIELLNKSDSDEQLENWRIDFLGRRGKISLILREIPELDISERKEAGVKANNLKKSLQESFEVKKETIKTSSTVNSVNYFDVTLPARELPKGSYHPTTQIVREISDAFYNMGFQIIDGPEVEQDIYNFQKLNIPIHHPARDMWNSLWIDKISAQGETPLLLRTHTSPMQIRILEKNTPPIRVLVPGKAYRYEATDATHEWQFYQIEGLVIDKNISFANLKGTLEEFAQRIFGKTRKSRFRCDFFPFVEPGAEMSIDCFKCNGNGCKVCRESGWIEILGAGMVHPEVLKGAGYDPNIYSGFAFGMGAERIAMLKHGIDDIRNFYLNDLRFLKQFIH